MDNLTDVKRSLRHQYRSLRRYIRANPEKGIALTFLGGVLVGAAISKIFK